MQSRRFGLSLIGAANVNAGTPGSELISHEMERLNPLYEVDSSFLPSLTLWHAFHAAQLNAAATAAIPIPAKTAVVRRGHRGLAQAFSRTCSGRMPIPTAYPSAR
jgi:hypothetical protein